MGAPDQRRGFGLAREIGLQIVDAFQADVQALLALFAQGKLYPPIARTYPIDDFVAAMEEAQRGVTAGRIVIGERSPRAETFAKLLPLPVDYFERRTAGMVTRYVQQTQTIRNFLTGSLFFTALESVMFFIFLPVLLAQGVDPVWLAMLITVNLQSSFLTPPFGWALHFDSYGADALKPDYLSSAFAPASSSFFFAASASAFETPSFGYSVIHARACGT